MAKSNQIEKPSKPYPEFPLYAHASRRWAKKIKGQTRYFGPWGDWQAALERYEHDVNYWQRGKTPPAMGKDNSIVTVGFLVNTFLEQREKKVQTGERSPRTYADYKRTGAELIKQLGRGTNVELLDPSDFEKLRNYYADRGGLVWLRNNIARAMAILNFAHKNDLIPHPIRTGESFKRPDKASIKKERSEKNNKRYSVAELKAIYKAANPQMKCFMLLALNGGLGNGDIGRLEDRHIQGDWIDFPRPKNQVDRRFRLWPETKRAIQATRQSKRPESPLVFLTKYGESWFKELTDDPISNEWGKLCKDVGHHVKGRGFYALRHMFRSVAQGARDREAIDLIMGHSNQSISEQYLEWGVDDKRLKAVTDYVRKWAKPIIKENKAKKPL